LHRDGLFLVVFSLKWGFSFGSAIFGAYGLHISRVTLFPLLALDTILLGINPWDWDIGEKRMGTA
jgi:hypothetical protein